jgi:sarcosine oxidase subunit gamma
MDDMSLAPDTDLRRFPSAPAAPACDRRQTITDLTARPRIGVRGRGAPDWCRANGLPFPEGVNGVVRKEGLCIARLGTSELLVLSESGATLPAGLSDMPTGAYSGYREESWAWFRFRGPGTLEALSSCTSAQLEPVASAPSGRVVQTRFAGLDAVIVLAGEGNAMVADVLADIASHGYLINVCADRCPQFRLSKLS